MSDDEDMSEHDIMTTLRALSRQSQDLPQALRGLLGQLGGDLPMMFGASNPQYRQLLEKIQPSNATHVQMASLSELCELLSMSSSEDMLTLSGFRADAFVPVLAELVASPPADSMEILLLSCRALAIVLDVCPSAVDIAVSANVVASLCDKLVNIEYMDVAELALRMLERLCTSPGGRAAALVENALVALLQFVDFFAVDVQRTAARTAALVCTDVPSLATVQMGGGVSLVVNLTRSFDADIVFHGVDCLNRLCHSRHVQPDAALTDLIDADTLDHVLSLLTTYPTTSRRMPDNMKPATYALLLHILTAVGRQHGRRMVDSGVVSVLCAILTQAMPHHDLVRQALNFLDVVVVALSSSDTNTDMVEIATNVLTTWLLPAVVASLARLADPADAATRSLRALYVHVLYSILTTVSHLALVHVDVLCAFVAATLLRPARRSPHHRVFRPRQVSAVGNDEDEADDESSGGGDQDDELSVALYVMSLALTHAHDIYHVRFVRDGVYHALEAVANQPVASADSQAATQLLATHATAATMTTPVLDHLVALAKDLHRVPPPTGDAVATRLQTVFASADGGVTPYELSTSQVLPALVAFFQSSPDALAGFRQVVLTGETGPQWVAALVSTLQEVVVANLTHPTPSGADAAAMSLSEVVSAISANGSSPTRNGTSAIVAIVELLGRHLKVRLHVDPTGLDATNQTIAPLDSVVLVEPLARVDTMQDFVAKKLLGKTLQETEDDDDDDDEDDLTPSTDDTKKPPLQVYTTLDGRVLAPTTTILQALIQTKYERGGIDGHDRPTQWTVETLWDDAVSLTFHVTEPKTAEAALAKGDAAKTYPAVGDCLALLELLHKLLVVPATTFETPALAVHIQRTCLMQPLVVALQAFPPVGLTILHSYAFLLPLETKLHFVYASTFGPARAILYLSKTLWKAEAAATGADATGRRRKEEAALAAAVTRVAKIPRLKVRVARSKLFQSAVKVMASYGGQKAIIEIEYLGEVGTGLGPTTEFYSLVSQEVQAKQLKLWRDDSDRGDADPKPDSDKQDAPEADQTQHAMPIRGYHRIAVVVCKTCTHISLPTCPDHNVLLTQTNDGSTKPTSTTEPQCNVCTTHPVWSPQCTHCATNESRDNAAPSETANNNSPASWRWWIVSDAEVAYLAQAFPRGKTSVVHPVLQCSHCDTVTFPGTDAGLVLMDGDRMLARSGRRMYERDYRAVTKHASVHCEGTPLTQTKVVLQQADVKTLVALVPQSPEVLDTQLDGLGINSTFHTELDAVAAPHGLFPRPTAAASPSLPGRVTLFDFLGKLVAQAFLDERLLDLPLAVPFLRLVRGEVLHTNLPTALDHISTVDPALGRSLTYLYDHRHDASIDDMGLTFVLPPSLPLCDNGADRPVTTHNVGEYLDLTAAALLHTSIKPQVDAFRAGFASIAPLHVLSILSADDWSTVLADPSRQMWPGGADEIRAAMVCDHGYSSDSRAIGWLVEILAEFSPEDQKLFVRFVTGSHRLPIGGLAKLDPTLTVVRKLTADDASSSNDAILPSASTCTNYLKLPDYSSKDVMRAKLLYCIHEGQLSFHLS